MLETTNSIVTVLITFHANVRFQVTECQSPKKLTFQFTEPDIFCFELCAEGQHEDIKHRFHFRYSSWLLGWDKKCVALYVCNFYYTSVRVALAEWARRKNFNTETNPGKVLGGSWSRTRCFATIERISKMPLLLVVARKHESSELPIGPVLFRIRWRESRSLRRSGEMARSRIKISARLESDHG